MTKVEKVQQFGERIAKVDEKIVAMARTLIATLKDAGRNATAAELGALFFERDSLDGERTEFLNGFTADDVVTAMEYYLKGRGKP